MKIEINNSTKDKIDLKFLEKFAKKILSFDKFETKILKKFSELSVAIVDEKKMVILNKQYKKHNYMTDVLTFDYGLQFGGQGEIIICLNQAKKQAKELNHLLKEELGILLLHGILHLAGYDEKTKKMRDKMFKKQNKILKELKFYPFFKIS